MWIVKPDASPEEVKAVVNDDQGGEIFSQAVSILLNEVVVLILMCISQLLNSNRYGEARTAYREVQERHEDIKRIEKTITELAQLFNDVSWRIPTCWTWSWWHQIRWAFWLNNKMNKLMSSRQQPQLLRKIPKSGETIRLLDCMNDAHENVAVLGTLKKPSHQRVQLGRSDGSVSSFASLSLSSSSLSSRWLSPTTSINSLSLRPRTALFFFTLLTAVAVAPFLSFLSYYFWVCSLWYIHTQRIHSLAP